LVGLNRNIPTTSGGYIRIVNKGALFYSEYRLVKRDIFHESFMNAWKGGNMGILAWIIVGLIAGWLAGELMRGSGFGLLGNIIVGIIGALLGGFLATALFNIPDPISGLDITTIIVAFLGSVVLLALLRLLRGARV
jgi:uncharacterized membrane protein YeaQ/YmgE (transglycosylase-associated protein family)